MLLSSFSISVGSVFFFYSRLFLPVPVSMFTICVPMSSSSKVIELIVFFWGRIFCSARITPAASSTAFCSSSLCKSSSYCLRMFNYCRVKFALLPTSLQISSKRFCSLWSLSSLKLRMLSLNSFRLSGHFKGIFSFTHWSSRKLNLSLFCKRLPHVLECFLALF